MGFWPLSVLGLPYAKHTSPPLICYAPGATLLPGLLLPEQSSLSGGWHILSYAHKSSWYKSQSQLGVWGPLQFENRWLQGPWCRIYSPVP